MEHWRLDGVDRERLMEGSVRFENRVRGLKRLQRVGASGQCIFVNRALKVDSQVILGLDDKVLMTLWSMFPSWIRHGQWLI